MGDEDWRDVDRAALLRQAEAGDTSAMYNLGVIAYYERDATTAVRWFHDAASLGDDQSMYNLGVVLAGLGNKAEAEPWFVAAANAGSGDAMINLAMLHNLADRPDRADYWRAKAEVAGYDLAGKKLPADVRADFARYGLPRESGSR